MTETGFIGSCLDIMEESQMINMIFAHFEDSQRVRCLYGAAVDSIDYCMVYYTNGYAAKVHIDDLTRKQRNFMHAADVKGNIKHAFAGCLYMHAPCKAILCPKERQRLARIRGIYAKRLIAAGWICCGTYVLCGEQRFILRKGVFK